MHGKWTLSSPGDVASTLGKRMILEARICDLSFHHWSQANNLVWLLHIANTCQERNITMRKSKKFNILCDCKCLWSVNNYYIKRKHLPVPVYKKVATRCFLCLWELWTLKVIAGILKARNWAFDPLGVVYNAPFALQVSIKCLLDEFSISLAIRLLCKMTSGHLPWYLPRNSVITASSCSILSMWIWTRISMYRITTCKKFSVKWCTDLSQTETALRKILLIQCNICTINYSFIFLILFQPLLHKSYYSICVHKWVLFQT
jgi:hypothetical protein